MIAPVLPITVECADAPIPQEAIEAVAALLLSVVDAQDEVEAREQGRATA